MTRGQTKRRRYLGCKVCGLRGVEGGCQACDLGNELVRCFGADQLALCVDGSYKDGYGGAGLVLVLGDPLHPGSEIVASRECGFAAESGTDAEFQAVIRGARWAPGVAIWTDERAIPYQVMRSARQLDVRYLSPDARTRQRSLKDGGGFGVPAHRIAHTLSVQGRCREDPAASPRTIEHAQRTQDLSHRQRKMIGAQILLEAAAAEPAFDGDFFALAERLGWTCGRLWRHNPNIRIAAERWAASLAGKISETGG